jgi:sigma-B regulation protein RsbU (phosphoserine phosphatase)
MTPPKSPNEAARLEALREYEILDTDPEVGFDDLASLAAQICGVPIAAITLIDSERQWFKSRVGIEDTETPLQQSLCAYAILRPQTLVIEDAARNEEFSGHPAVEGDEGIRFYAGTPLVTPEGFALGTICVADSVPRRLELEQLRALEALARQTQTQLEMRRRLRDLRRASAVQARLEAEKAVKTAEIERDLDFARRFQQSLLPDALGYPAVPTETAASGEAAHGHEPARMRLSFHHVYQPALSLGGDFFDVLKLSESRAGVFIADVMGHGARSALVTAILRTLFQELAPQFDDPGQLLGHLNARFQPIVQGSQQFLFVSACYLILDTESARGKYALAGHPAPICADHGRQNVAPLDESCAGDALGLSGEGTYLSRELSIAPGDTFLLFTDGLVEAPNSEGEEFGEERVCRAIRHAHGADAARLTQCIMDALAEWTGGASLPDDLCLVAAQAVCEGTAPTTAGEEISAADTHELAAQSA